MLEKFIEPITEYTGIPLTNNRFKIMLNGVIVDEENNPVITSIINGEHYSYLPLWKGYDYYKTAIILNLTFKPIHIPVHLYYLLDVLYIDGNSLNLHPSNVIWCNKIKIESKISPGYYFIPGASRYLINEDGKILNYLTNVVREFTKPKLNFQYNDISIYLDIDKRTTIGLHRLLCLVFKEYPANVDVLDVNHIDKIPSNNFLPNLEWVSRKRNIEHALENNDNSFNTVILVKDIETNNIQRFLSYRACALAFDKDAETIRYRCNATNSPIFEKKYIFRSINKPTGNDDFDWKLSNDKQHAAQCYFTSKDIFTGEYQNYRTLKDAAKALKTSESNILGHFLGGVDKRPLKRYIFKYADDIRDWYTYDDDEIELFKQCADKDDYLRGLGYIVTDTVNNSRHIFASVFNAAELVGLSRTGLYLYIKNSTIANERYKIQTFYHDYSFKTHN